MVWHGLCIKDIVMISNSSLTKSSRADGNLAEPTKAILQCCESRKRRTEHINHSAASARFGVAAAVNDFSGGTVNSVAERGLGGK